MSRLCWVVEIFGGILYRQKKTAELEDQLLFESLMAKLSAQLVSHPVEQTESLIREFLGLLCESFGVDRCSIWERTFDSPESVLLTHIFQPVEAPPFERLMDPDILADHDRIQLSRKDTTPQIRINLATLFPWAFRQLERGETIVIPSLDDLPEEAACDKRTFRAYATKSNVTVPLLVGQEWLGILTFASILEERNWTEQEVKRFQIVGDLLMNALVRQRADQELRRSENRYRCLFETVSDAIFLVDSSTGRIVDANPTAERMYGYGRDELRQLSMSDLSAEPQKTIQSISMHEKHVPLRWHRRRNGVPFPVEILVSDFAGQDPRAVVAAIRDITERERMAQELRVSAARYQSLVETQADVIARSDLEGRLTYVNDAYCRMFGVSRREVIGKLFFPTVLPEDLPTSQAALESIQAPPYRATTETRHLTPWGIRWISWENTAVVDPSGRVLELQGTGRDITERKQAQEDLRRSEERYRAFVELSSEGIARFEADRPIDVSLPETEQMELLFHHAYLAECNKAFVHMRGIEKVGDIIGLCLGQILDRSNPENQGMVRSFLRSGYRLEESELRRGGANGDLRFFSINIRGVIQDGYLVRAWFLQREITERKLAEEELHESERALRQSEEELRNLAGRLIYAQEEERRRLARELHDDLSQRLAMLAIDAESLQQDLATSAEPLQRQLRNIQEQVVEVSKDVHGLSRRLHPSILETLGLANAIRSECRSFTQREGVAVQIDAQPIPANIGKEVPLCIYRIVQEGLRNIARHARATEARISLSTEDDAILLRIQDDGIGFHPHLARRRAGLGLASMDERVRLLQGTVRVDSEPGKGTVIYLRIPLGATSNLEVLSAGRP